MAEMLRDSGDVYGLLQAAPEVAASQPEEYPMSLAELAAFEAVNPRMHDALRLLIANKGVPTVVGDILDCVPGASRDASKKAFHNFLKQLSDTELGKDLNRHGATNMTFYWFADPNAEPPALHESNAKRSARLRTERALNVTERPAKDRPPKRKEAFVHLPPGIPEPLSFVRPIGFIGPERPERQFRYRSVGLSAAAQSTPGYTAVTPAEDAAPSAPVVATFASQVVDWRTKSECIGDGANQLFIDETLPKWEMIAKRICSTCTVVEQCIEEALNIKPEFGIWGGLQASQLEYFTSREDDALVSRCQIEAVTDVIRDGDGIKHRKLLEVLRAAELALRPESASDDQVA